MIDLLDLHYAAYVQTVLIRHLLDGSLPTDEDLDAPALMTQRDLSTLYTRGCMTASPCHTQGFFTLTYWVWLFLSSLLKLLSCTAADCNLNYLTLHSARLQPTIKALL